MSNRMWGGRFASGPDAIMEEINASIGFDQRLLQRGRGLVAVFGLQGAGAGDDRGDVLVISHRGKRRRKRGPTQQPAYAGRHSSGLDDDFAQPFFGEEELHGFELTKQFFETAIIEKLSRPTAACGRC